jgi:hypothetical protein
MVPSLSIYLKTAASADDSQKEIRKKREAEKKNSIFFVFSITLIIRDCSEKNQNPMNNKGKLGIF